MKIFKKALALVLVLLSVTALLAGTVSADNDGFKEGDVIYVDYTQMPDFHTGSANVGWEVVESYLYINFTANTRYDSGEKEKVYIGEDTDRFNPKAVTEKISDCFYSYTVTAEDAGSDVLRFWRGSKENLWNHSVELTYADFLNGNNTVVITDYNIEAEGSGYLEASAFYPYDIEAVLTVTPPGGEKGQEHQATLYYEEPVNADVTYKYEIIIDSNKGSDSETCTFVPELNVTQIEGIITAYFENGEIAAQDKVSLTLRLADFAYINAQPDNLYAHAISDGGQEKEAWVNLKNIGDTSYFFMPSSTSNPDNKQPFTFETEILNTYNYPVTFNGVEIPAGEVKTITFKTAENGTSEVYKAEGALEADVIFMCSTAESSLFVNNDFSKTEELWDYLCKDKSNSTSAWAAIVNSDGTVNDTDLKKIKGRGNTTWNADKKPFNLNFEDTVQVGSIIQKTKQFSLLANFQDAALCRNRILYDLGDAVGMRYSSDSCFVDFYVDGEYKGSYQMCQKIEPGKKNLVFDVADDDHLDENGNLKEQFSMLLEVPFGEDFYTSTNSGIDVVIKSPNVEDYDNLYADEVKAYAKKLFDEMYLALKNNSENLGELIDIDSFAKAFLVQELGKNWDTHSWYLTYVPDEDGNYKFYAAPVWDFDNSIGNAHGVQSDLNGFGVKDYTEYTGWWCQYKKGSNNLSYLSSKNTQIMSAAQRVWFEDFVPAIDTFMSSGNADDEILSYDVYYSYLAASADMNYMIWEMEADNEWICDHSSLTKAEFDYDTLTYTTDSKLTSYDQFTFKGQFDYMTDWFLSRSAWISEQWKDYLLANPENGILGDADLDGKVSIKDATAIQKESANIKVYDFSESLADVNADGKVNVKDATAIQKYCAYIESDLNIGKPYSK